MQPFISLPGRWCIVSHVILSLLLCHFATANTEKVIFTGPSSVLVPQTSPAIADLRLHVLTPADPSLRANLSRVFPEGPRDLAVGQSTWVLLDDLTAEQRYELRICWAATQPTTFHLDIFELDTVWETPELIQSLSEYAYSHQLVAVENGESEIRHGSASSSSTGEREASILFLRIQAAADYFTHHTALMKDPPPVLSDIILDPYLYNLVPHSLLNTIGYLLLVGVVTWYVASFAATSLQSFASNSGSDETKKKI